jgi:hypothetical protein
MVWGYRTYTSVTVATVIVRLLLEVVVLFPVVGHPRRKRRAIYKYVDIRSKKHLFN